MDSQISRGTVSGPFFLSEDCDQPVDAHVLKIDNNQTVCVHGLKLDRDQPISGHSSLLYHVKHVYVFALMPPVFLGQLV